MGNSEAKPRASPITASSDVSVASLLKQFTNSARPDDPPNAEPSSGKKQEQAAEEDEYPRRRGVLDCFYYVKFGSCKYGMNCQFNHPPKPSGWPAPAGDRHEQELAAAESEYPRRPGGPDCAHYVKFGSCKYGMNCMFNHPPKPSGWPAPAGEKYEQELAAAEPEYPWRPWEPDCSYYVKFGSCKYGMNCKFNHPPKTSRWPAPAGEKQQKPEEAAAEPEYPRRPGEPDCSYYVKFGSCKYGMNCKFNHPLRKLVPKGSGSVGGGTNSSNSSEASSSEYRQYLPGKTCKYNNHEGGETEVEQVKLNFLGLPLRPGTSLCSNYMRSGMCEFGSNCKFHHPEPESEHENCDASRHAIQGSSQLNSSGLDQEALKEQSVPFLSPSPSCRRSGIIPPQGVYPYPDCTGYQVDENKQGKPDWDPFAAKVFCGICADEVLAGNRPTNHLNAIGYNNLCTKFNEKTKRGYNHEQLKSKWEELEKDYQIWKLLTGSETGLGCDPKKNATYASPEWWAEKTEAMPDCGKGLLAPLENVDLLNIIFGDIMDLTDVDLLNIMFGDIMDSTAIKTTIGSEQCFGDASDMGVIDKDVQKQSEETTLRSNKEPNSMKPKTNNVHAALTHLVDNAERVNPSNSTTSRRFNQVGCGISEIMELVVDAGAGEGSEEHFIATQLFIIPEYRQMFLTLKTPQGRLGWLNRMCQGKEKQ